MTVNKKKTVSFRSTWEINKASYWFCQGGGGEQAQISCFFTKLNYSGMSEIKKKMMPHSVLPGELLQPYFSLFLTVNWRQKSALSPPVMVRIKWSMRNWREWLVVIAQVILGSLTLRSFGRNVMNSKEPVCCSVLGNLWLEVLMSPLTQRIAPDAFWGVESRSTIQGGLRRVPFPVKDPFSKDFSIIYSSGSACI